MDAETLETEAPDLEGDATDEDALAAEMSEDGDSDVSEDEPQPEDEPEVEAEDEPEARELSSFTITEQLAKKIDSENRRHENALAKLYGDSWVDYNLCALCLGDGFVLPPPGDFMPDEQWAAVTAMAGKMGERPLSVASYAEVCQECDGWGELLTGAKNDSQAVLPCKRCNGTGWFDKETRPNTGVAATAAPYVASGLNFPTFHTPEAAPAGNGAAEAAPVGWYEGAKAGADSWGRWPGHSRYGIDPAVSGGVW